MKLIFSDYAYVSTTWNFRIIDNSKGTDNVFQVHTPVLKTIYFGMDAVANDLLYQNGKVRIYGKRSSSQRPSRPSLPQGKHKKRKNKRKRKPINESCIEDHSFAVGNKVPTLKEERKTKL